ASLATPLLTAPVPCVPHCACNCLFAVGNVVAELDGSEIPEVNITMLRKAQEVSIVAAVQIKEFSVGSISDRNSLQRDKLLIVIVGEYCIVFKQNWCITTNRVWVESRYLIHPA